MSVVHGGACWGFLANLWWMLLAEKCGLMLLWKDSIDVTVISFFSSHVDCLICIPECPTWRFTGFYGHPEKDLRKISWELLRKLARDPNVARSPWVEG